MAKNSSSDPARQGHVPRRGPTHQPSMRDPTAGHPAARSAPQRPELAVPGSGCPPLYPQGQRALWPLMRPAAFAAAGAGWEDRAGLPPWGLKHLLLQKEYKQRDPESGQADLGERAGSVPDHGSKAGQNLFAGGRSCFQLVKNKQTKCNKTRCACAGHTAPAAAGDRSRRYWVSPGGRRAPPSKDEICPPTRAPRSRASCIRLALIRVPKGVTGPGRSE